MYSLSNNAAGSDHRGPLAEAVPGARGVGADSHVEGLGPA